MDYYGSVLTNTKGTFTLQLEHMSTYLITDHKLIGAENKATGIGLNSILGPGGSGISILNPSTGAGD